ncbi:hypothetical protein D9611_006159 [Ephemerocybe angulata]|uniref:Uncharacterized protein n=1 Tax=Ephemerocybe angulata TaxID=980116 RepID=A0A8H5CH88_9AGAR|nr:hypothetical protein D9611_006159 [Tulosesus angulatus]
MLEANDDTRTPGYDDTRGTYDHPLIAAPPHPPSLWPLRVNLHRSLDRPSARTGTPIPISFVPPTSPVDAPFGTFMILFLGVTTYVSLDIGLGVTQLIGGVESPPEALRNISLFVLTSAA